MQQSFMDAVVREGIKPLKHHPEWANVFRTVYIRWTTHNPPGLSRNDLRLAAICDEAEASRLPKTLPAEQDQPDEPPDLRGVLDRVK